MRRTTQWGLAALLAMAAMSAGAAPARGRIVKPMPGPHPEIREGEVYHGQVTDVVGGDIVYITRDDHAHMITTLSEADAPEQGQPYAQAAQNFLSRLLSRKQVTVQVMEVAPHKMVKVRLWVGNTDVVYAMLANGYAWLQLLDTTPSTYLEAQTNAQQAHRGLWADAEPEDPAKWRQEHMIGINR